MENFFSLVLSRRIPLRKYLGGFTLVELIVVITILAVLSAIGLVSFSSFNSGARDSTRVEDLTNMQKSLAISATTSVNGKYPTPDNGIQILNGGNLMNTQGYAGKTTLSTIKFNGAGLDPLDSTYYTYSVNKTQTGFALLAYLENASNLTLTSYIEKSLAATTDYSTRYPMVSWNPIGVLIASGSLQPIQATVSAPIELTTSTTPYTAYIAPKNTVTWSGTSFASSFAVATSPSVLTYASGALYTIGQNFVWSGAMVTVMGIGIGTVSTKSMGCDTNDIAIWQGGTNNIQIWSACNAWSSIAGTSSSSYGSFYQWWNNGDNTSTSNTGTLVNTSGYGPWNYYNNAAYFISWTDWSSVQNDDLWGNVTNTSIARQWPCMVGYHVPTGGTSDTTTEWGTFYTIVNSSTTFGTCTQSDVFNRMQCALKIPSAGDRSRTWGGLGYVGVNGVYWSSSPTGTTNAWYITFQNSGGGSMASSYGRAGGFSVRCLRN